MNHGQPQVFYSQFEANLLDAFWTAFEEQVLRDSGRPVVGFNHRLFDIPFLVRRSWILRVPVPMMHVAPNPKYLHTRFVDLMDVWQCGNREDRPSLATLSSAFGVGKKEGSGADFYKLLAEDQPKAENYLRQDLALTGCLATRML